MVFILSVFLNQVNVELEKVRSQFPEITSEEQANSFIEKLKNDDSSEAKGYTAAMIFMKSSFVKFPFTKLKYFKQGKTLLDETITQDPSNIEIRYIRFLMQKQIPDFLGYNENIKEDFNIIVNGLKTCNLQREAKSQMLQNMLLTKDLTPGDQEKLKQLLKTV